MPASAEPSGPSAVSLPVSEMTVSSPASAEITIEPSTSALTEQPSPQTEAIDTTNERRRDTIPSA